MCICKECENLILNEPIKIIDWKSKSPFGTDLYHFEDGYRCSYNGIESVELKDLKKGKCRLR